MLRALVLLREGKPARLVERTSDEEMTFRGLGLLSSKPVLYVCNVEESAADKGNDFSERVKAFAAKEGNKAVVVSAKIESEIAVLPLADQKDYLDAVGLLEPGLNRVIREGYALLACSPISRWTQGSAGLDDHTAVPGACCCRRDPHGFREGFHPLRDYCLCRLHRQQW